MGPQGDSLCVLLVAIWEDSLLCFLIAVGKHAHSRADWMRRAIDCHRARFERLGEPPIYFPEDPTLVARSTVTVEERDGHLEVEIETADDMTAQVALARARDLVRLVRPRTAGR
jgi:hypothetical protein